jgi:orotate phosphoribosyltransferase
MIVLFNNILSLIYESKFGIEYYQKENIYMCEATNCAHHLLPSFCGKLKKVVAKTAIDKLKLKDFDSIAYSGMSGALIASIVSMELDKGLFCVRKESDKNHSGRRIESGFKKSKKYIIIDDLIDSGDTIKYIVENMTKEYPETRCVGIYLYNTSAYQIQVDEYTGISILNDSKTSVRELYRSSLCPSCSW